MLGRIFLVLPFFLLMACNSDERDNLCRPVGDNYLQDADFALEAENRRAQHWTGLQHAGERSFNASISNGELTITKFATQPWYLFRQRLKGEDLAGKKMVFSAELKLDIHAPATPHGFKVGGGLNLVARSERGKIVLHSILNHEPILGTHDWHQARVTVQLPADTTMVEVGFLHQADGTLQVRKPSFYEVEDSPDTCRLTPESKPGS